METKRNSNMELLRVIAMLMIVAYHIYYHCVSDQLLDGVNTLFGIPAFSKKLLILAFLAPFGQIGNVIFITLSGYFMVTKGDNINLMKISKKLILQFGFSTLILMLISNIVYACWNGADGYYPVVLEITHFNYRSWFVGYYFIVMVIAKTFLNKYLSGFDRQRYITFLLALFLIISASWTINLLAEISTGLGVVLTGVFLYALGGYIKIYNPFEKLRTPILFLILIIVFLLVFQSNYNVFLNSLSAYDGEGFLSRAF